jgi:competence protein ComEC
VWLFFCYNFVMKLLPIIIPALGFVFGIALASLFCISLPILIWFLTLALASFLFWQHHHKLVGSILWYFVSVFVIFVAIGSWWMTKNISYFDDSPLLTKVGEVIKFEGVVGRDVERGNNNAKVYLETESGTILVFTDRHTTIKYGDKINVEGRLQQPEPFDTDLGRVFDYKNYLRAQKVGLIVRYPEIELLATNQGNPIISSLLGIKKEFETSLESNLPEPASGLALGLLLGVKGAISEELEDSFRRSGVIHIVVLSGYNIMLVVGFVLFILGRLFRAKARFVLGVAAIICFACLVGFSATVVRASIMATLLLFVELTGRRYDALRALLVAGIFMLILNPYLLLYDVGFQLSFVATWGLIVFSPVVEKWVSALPTTLGIRTLVAATVATQVAVLPLLLYQIGEVSLVSIIANVLILPIVPVAMLFAFLLGIVGFFSTTLALPITALAYTSLIYIVEVASKLAEFSLATVSVPFFPSAAVFLMYGLLIYFWLRPKDVVTKEGESLDGWTIVEESAVAVKSEPKTKAAESQSDSAATLPIFFR